MKIVFLGTPDYVLPVLEKLYKEFRTNKLASPIVAVVTQGPKPVGRKQILTYSPVDAWAHQHKVPIYYKVADLIKDKIEAEVAVLESYGSILSKAEIDYFPKGIINIHPSLLPRWRGASPVPATLVAGDLEAGGTVIKLDEQIDHGPILTQFKEEVLPDDTTETLRKRLFARAADVIVGLLPAYLKGKITLKPQEDNEVTLTTRITKEEGFIPGKYLEAAISGKSLEENWPIPWMKNFAAECSPFTVYNFIRAMNPWPYAWTKIIEKRLKIISAHLEKSLSPIRYTLVLDEVQLEGKEPVSWKQFQQGYPEAKFT